jgi:hypothetical protein
MPPAVVAVAATVATVAVKLFVKSKILAAILMIAISVAAVMLQRKPQGRTNQGQELKLKLDPAMPRQIVLGTTATGGSVVWAFTYGSSSGIPGGRWLVRIIALSDLPCTGLVAIMEGKEALQFSGDVTTGWRTCTNKHKSDGGTPLMQARVYLGSSTPVADTTVVTNSGGVWTAAHKGYNMCYAIVKYEYDIDGFAYPNGEPQLRFVLNGVACYDDRKDTTVGGSGLHRLNNPATWEYTSNVAVLTAQLLRGFHSNGVLLIGAEAEERDLNFDMLVSAYNTCDQSVTHAAGNMPRYSAGMMATASEPLVNVLQEMQAAMDGRIIDRGGAITILPGATRTPVFNLTDDDINWQSEKSYQPRSTLSELYNHVAGVYIDESTIYQELPYPPLINTAWEADDGGERFTLNVSFAAVTNYALAQRITKRIHQSSRFQGTVGFLLPLWAIEMEQGDWFTLTSVRWGFTTKYFDVLHLDITDDLQVAVVARETSPDIDSWNHVSDEKPRNDTYWNAPVIVMPTLNPTATAIKMTSSTGIEIFGVKLSITDLPLGSDVFTQLQVQLALTSNLAAPWSLNNISAINQDAEFYGLTPGTNYSIRVRGTNGTNYGPWSTWDAFTTAGQSYGVTVTITPSITINANYSGTPLSGQLPRTIVPAVIQGSTDIKLNDNVHYSITTSNCTASVSNLDGAGNKGNITLTAISAASGYVELTVSVDGAALAPVRTYFTRQDEAAPPPPAGGGNKLFTWDPSELLAVSGTSFLSIGTVMAEDIVVASGEKLYITGSLVYQAEGGPIGSEKTPTFKFQYSVAGAGVWSDFNAGIVGSASAVGGETKFGGEWIDPIPGAVTLTHDVSPGAGTYDIRILAKNDVSSGQVTVYDGSTTVEAKV